MKVLCAHTEMSDLDLLVANPRNPNKHPESQIKLLAKIMKHQGWRAPIVVSQRSGFITKGHGRLMAAQLNGWEQAPVDRQDYASEADEYADMVADNKIAELSETDLGMVNIDVMGLGPDFDLDLLGIPGFAIDPAEKDTDPNLDPKGNMRDRFIQPPFSVLNAREGDWQDRKRAWVSIGIQSELGRGGGGEMTASFKSQEKLSALRHQTKKTFTKECADE